jgi:pyroglutamyl-peptidase
MRILITGFEHYGNTETNPAQKVVERLESLVLAGQRLDPNFQLVKGVKKLVTLVVPNNFFESIDVVRTRIEEACPDVVIMLGEYPGRAMITLERFATNFNDSSRYGLKDNKGVEMTGDLTFPGGPLAYQSTLPVRAIVKNMRAVGIPADISDTGGTFVCNHLFYGILHSATQNLSLQDNHTISVGWVHLPFLPVTASLPGNLGQPSMSLETSLQGVLSCLATIVGRHGRGDIQEVSLSRLQL